MERKEAVKDVLNDLLKINNDRIKEYQKACKAIADFHWQNIFLGIIDESKKFSLELTLAVLRHGGSPRIGATTTSGKIYRFWAELKDTLTGRDRESILNECEFVEDGVLKAYARALEHDGLGEDLRPMIQQEYETIKISHDGVNRYRDMALMELYKV